MEGLFMPEKEMWNIFQMVSHVIDLMDKAETPENEELFEKIRWALGEQEHTIVTLSNCIESMREAHLTFSENFFNATEEINQKYNKPKEAK
jgi:hypothetical protein